jgi:Tfp pilus assembly protein PilF
MTKPDCGSGKKYKKCCQSKDEAPEREELAKGRREEREEAHRAKMRRAKEEYFASLVPPEEEEDAELTKASNAAVDLVQVGKFEEAEAAARDLITRYPEVHDGWDRLGMIYEAKGENKTAADCYRKALSNSSPDSTRRSPAQIPDDYAHDR